VFSFLFHLVLVGAIDSIFPNLIDANPNTKHAVTMRIELPEAPDPLVENEEDPVEQGQIVDIAPPKEEIRPVEADYLAEYDQKVPKQTRTEEYRVNPEVLANEYSPDDKLEFEDLNDVNAVEPSTGAQVGNHRFEPDIGGSLAALPSPFAFTNKDGLQKPVPASHSSSQYAGAPNNDRLDLAAARRLALDTHKIQFAGYLNRVRRLVSFYWSQNIKNLPNSARSHLRQPSYHTAVFAILDDTGRLETVEVTTTSGSRHMDRAVKRAFQIAAPFPNPPAGLIAKDGRVYLPDFEFTVTMGAPSAAYRALDARAGVQFPGILKATR
jgi:TonB family protein